MGKTDCCTEHVWEVFSKNGFSCFLKFLLIADELYALIHKAVPDFRQCRKWVIRGQGQRGRWSIKVIIVSKRYLTLTFPSDYVGDPGGIEGFRKKFLSETLHKLKIKELNEV